MAGLEKLLLFFLLIITFSCNNQEEQPGKAIAPSNDLKSLQNAVARYPDSLQLNQELIQAYRNSNDYNSAISLTSSLIKKDSNNAFLWNIMATLNYENGDTAKTIRSLEKAISIYPLPEYYIALGTVYAEVQNKDALAISNMLIDNESRDNRDDAYFIKGLYYNYAHEPQKAIKVLDSCISINYTYMYAYREKAIALYDLKKYQAAIEVLTRAVTLQNNFDEGYYWMGKTYEKLNKTDSAIQSYQNALLYDKNFTEASDALDRLTNQNN